MNEATEDAYHREWLLFSDWCQSKSLRPLPAAAATVTAFLALLGSGSSRRRAVAAIRHRHRCAGAAQPELPAGQPGRPLSGVDPALVSAALKDLPRWGWTAGLFGRRDAALLVLRFTMGLSPEALAELEAADVVPDGRGGLTVRGRSVPGDPDPDLCAGCIWAQWVTVLQNVYRFTPARMLANSFNPPDPHQSSQHVCETENQVVPGPALLSFDRWGAAQLPVRPISPQGLRGVADAHRAGHAPARLFRADFAGRDAGFPIAATTPPPPLISNPWVAERGRRIKQAGLVALEDASRALDSVSLSADAINDHLDRLLAEAETFRDRISSLSHPVSRPSS